MFDAHRALSGHVPCLGTPEITVLLASPAAHGKLEVVMYDLCVAHDKLTISVLTHDKVTAVRSSVQLTANSRQRYATPDKITVNYGTST